MTKTPEQIADWYFDRNYRYPFPKHDIKLAFIDGMKYREDHPDWIDVKDSRNALLGTPMCCTDGTNIFLAEFDGVVWVRGSKIVKITHFMYLKLPE